MSTTVTYKGETLTTAENQTKTLRTSGKYLEDDLTIVDVTSGGGGGSSWTLIHKEDIDVTFSSTTATFMQEITVDGIFTTDLICVIITDKAGARNNYFYRFLAWFCNIEAKNGTTGTISTSGRQALSKDSNGKWTNTQTQYGVYPHSIASSGKMQIYARYNSSYSHTIDSTYTVQVYKLSLPDGSTSPFD